MIPSILGTNSLFSGSLSAGGTAESAGARGLAGLFSKLLAGHTSGQSGDVSGFLTAKPADLVPSDDVLKIEKALADFLRGVESADTTEGLLNKLENLQSSLTDAGLIDGEVQITSFEMVMVSFQVVGAENPDAAMAQLSDALESLALSFDMFDQLLAASGEPSLVNTTLTELTLQGMPIGADYVRAAFHDSDSLPTAERLTTVILKQTTMFTSGEGGALPVDGNVAASQLQAQAASARQPEPRAAALASVQQSVAPDVAMQQQMVEQAATATDMVPEEDGVLPQARGDATPQRDKPRTTTALGADQKLVAATGEKLFVAKIDAGQLMVENEPDAALDADILDAFEQVQDSSRKTRFDAKVESQQFQHMNRAVAQQTVLQMKSLITQGGGEVRFTLNPQELGQVDIELEIVRGAVKGSIAVQNPEVAEMLSRDLRALDQSLQESGLALHEEGLAFYLKQDGEGRGGNGNPFAGDENNGDSQTIAAADETASTAGWVNPDALVDVNV